MKNIILAKIVNGTATEKEGMKFYHLLLPFLQKDLQVNISLRNTTPLASNFWSASIGSLVEEFGIEKFKSLISFTHFTKFQARQLKRYFKISQIRN